MIKYNSLADLNGQALAWCNKVNGRVHATTNEIPFERLKKEGLTPLITPSDLSRYDEVLYD